MAALNVPWSCFERPGSSVPAVFLPESEAEAPVPASAPAALSVGAGAGAVPESTGVRAVVELPMPVVAVAPLPVSVVAVSILAVLPEQAARTTAKVPRARERIQAGVFTETDEAMERVPCGSANPSLGAAI